MSYARIASRSVQYGQTALHMAVSRDGPEALVRALCDAYPEATQMKDQVSGRVIARVARSHCAEPPPSRLGGVARPPLTWQFHGPCAQRQQRPRDLVVPAANIKKIVKEAAAKLQAVEVR